MGRRAELEGGRAPRLTYLITSSGMGGAEQEVCHLAREFGRRGWRVAVISMLPLVPPIADLRGSGVETYSLGMRQGVPDPRAVFGLARLLRVLRPDVLHAHMVHANLLARLSRVVARTPVVISTIHNENEGPQWRYWAYRVTDRLSDLTSAVSNVALAEALRRGAAPPGRIVMVPNGLSATPYEPSPAIRARLRSQLGLDDRFMWLAVGRLVEAKGYPDMLAAFAELRRSHPESSLLVAGTGSLEPELRRLSREAAGGHVEWLGLRSDVPALMQAADGFVMTSRWEGLPMVLLEAAASGLPIVASDVGGTRDVVVDGVTGAITEVGSPTSTARAMADVMDLTVEERLAMGEAGRRLVRETFEIVAVADTWERLYASALRGRNAA